MRPAKFVDSIIREVNPLEIPQEDGTAYVFHTRMDNYVCFMDLCYDIAPMGYIDLLVLLCRMFNWKLSTSKSVYTLHLKKVFAKRWHMIEFGDSKSKMFFRKLLICLHERTKTDFDLSAFERAFSVHLEHVKSKKLKIK